MPVRIEIADVDLREEGPRLLVWIAPAANPAVRAAWVDRIYFVPAP